MFFGAFLSPPPAAVVLVDVVGGVSREEGKRRAEHGGGVALGERESSHLCLDEDLLKKVNIVDDWGGQAD